ncbi:hypothetical protein CFU_2132 [Collimonas fungivorans Ter331]|uniref:Uncharacterized protein n=1 Tax=Collimonas fungivorans (strain Ter331) TaxID=1005048 RepID=G0AGV7_COLFT|nr:hypothetical protein CFU_2132 [Collimonas fungivorans Ter331]
MAKRRIDSLVVDDWIYFLKVFYHLVDSTQAGANLAGCASLP